MFVNSKIRAARHSATTILYCWGGMTRSTKHFFQTYEPLNFQFKRILPCPLRALSSKAFSNYTSFIHQSKITSLLLCKHFLQQICRAFYRVLSDLFFFGSNFIKQTLQSSVGNISSKVGFHLFYQRQLVVSSSKG